MRSFSVAIQVAIALSAWAPSSDIVAQQAVPSKPTSFHEALIQGIPISGDSEYGYSPKKPVKIGGGQVDFRGHHYREQYLSLLRGPKGKKIKYRRIGQGGFYESENSPLASLGYTLVPIDKYEVRIKESGETVTVYISIYDFEDLKIPQGFTVDEDRLQELLSTLRGD
jgi:hypothetical protein